MPVSAGGTPAFFPPSMPSFWHSSAFIHHQQQQINALSNNVVPPPMAPVSSPVPPQMPMFPPSVTAFPPLVPHPTLTGTSPLVLPPLTAPVSTVPSLQPTSFMNNPLSPPAAPSPTFPSTAPTPSPPAGVGPGETASGVGTLVWLSSQAGLIKSEGDMGLISFQLKNFCDQAVTDLTSVLRPGFTLKFQAIAAPAGSDGTGQWVATFVAPLHGSDAKTAQSIEANLESPPGMETGPPHLPRDPYNLELEGAAIPMLLGIFERNGQPMCQLALFHCQISNCGDEELYRYVGTSSLKRRQFLERRTHLFSISQNDVVSLQPAPVNTTIRIMAEHLLKRGGACLMQELFEHFNECPEIPLEARDLIGEGKNQFLRFLESHPWIFSVFPSRVFVSVRRQLPNFDYAAYLNEHFEDVQESVLPPCASAPAGDKRMMTNGIPNGVSWGEDQASALVSGRRAFGSALSLTGLEQATPVPNPALATAVPPTPTHSLPPGTPIWGPLNDGSVLPPLSVAAPIVDVGAEFSVKPISWPEPKVGGKIKRFTDVETQTDQAKTTTAGEEGPMMADAEVQATVRCVSTGCGPDDPDMFPPVSSQNLVISGDSFYSFSVSDGGSFGTSSSTESAKVQSGKEDGLGFDPLFDRTLNLMSFGGLKLEGLQLGH